MTAKRFTKVSSDGYWKIKDSQADYKEIWDLTNPQLIEDRLNQLNDENEQLRKDSTVLIYSNQDYMKENEQLKEELKEFKDFVYSDEKILCYTCVNCLSKGIYQIECSEKGKVDVHGSCFAYWKKELEG